MKIAVTYDQGMVFQHFGHTEVFKIYEIDNDEIVSSKVVSTNGAGHCALANFLAQEQVDALICGGIGMGAINALTNAGIEIFPGVMGEVDLVVNEFIAGILAFDPNTKCNDHEHHDCHSDECHHEHCHHHE